MPESPRWYEVKGRHEEADSVVRDMEQRAMEQHGLTELPQPAEHVLVSEAHGRWRDLWAPDLRSKTIMMLIVNASDRKVVGAHILGHEAGEMAQLLGITLKAGCTKDDFDRTMAVHPTAAEELVTMYAPSYRVVNGERV